MTSHPAIEIRDLSKKFSKKPDLVQKLVGLCGVNTTPPTVHAVSNISLSIQKGEVLGLVGESGCGKSTLGRMVAGLIRPSEGSIHYQQHDISTLRGKALLDYTLGVQMIFQDPQASLNPKQKLHQILGEALKVHKLATPDQIPDRVDAALAEVGLDKEYRNRYPYQISGGQRQRIGIARALMVQPSFLVCDEPVAALDVSIQAQVINLFMDLRDQRNLTYLFISHDLGVVRHISDRVAIMYLGRIVEIAPTSEVFNHAAHPYTQALLAEMPDMSRQKRNFTPIKGELPSPLNPPSGCAFHPRCPHAMPRCREEAPVLRSLNSQHQAACHLLDA